jgi:hypothetical protein
MNNFEIADPQLKTQAKNFKYMSQEVGILAQNRGIEFL